MNYRPLLNSKLQEFEKKYPSYTLGQTIYAMFVCAKNFDFSKEALVNISDEELYKSLSHAFNNEDEE